MQQEVYLAQNAVQEKKGSEGWLVSLRLSFGEGCWGSIGHNLNSVPQKMEERSHRWAGVSKWGYAGCPKLYYLVIYLAGNIVIPALMISGVQTFQAVVTSDWNENTSVTPITRQPENWVLFWGHIIEKVLNPIFHCAYCCFFSRATFWPEEIESWIQNS